MSAARQLSSWAVDEREVAKKVLREHWNGAALSIDPEPIAKALGCRVNQVAMPNGESGQFVVEGEVPVIMVNSSESRLRQRFTIAHELGHFLLGHGPMPRDGSIQYSIDNYEPKEASANRFAAELLMPAEVVRRLVFDNNISNVSRLAEIMKVSEVAMKYRLKNLRITP